MESYNTGTFRVWRERKDWKEITQDIKGDLVEVVWWKPRRRIFRKGVIKIVKRKRSQTWHTWRELLIIIDWEIIVDFS